jgi:hypothetical protein
MDISIFFPDVFDVRELVGLIVVGDVLASHAVCIPSLLQSSIVQLSTPVYCPGESLYLFPGRVQSECVCLLRHAFGSQYTV